MSIKSLDVEIKTLRDWKNFVFDGFSSPQTENLKKIVATHCRSSKAREALKRLTKTSSSP